jgi:predicted DNA binding CopG/RHH family protein
MKFELKKLNKKITDKELLEDLNNVAKKMSKRTLTYWEYTNSNINKFHG